jgi:hypothetical protein
LVKD